MRHPGSGPQHTLSPQPSLTDGRGEEGGRGRGGVGWGWSGGCILTIHRSILSSLNLPSFLPFPRLTLFPPFSWPLLLLLHLFHLSTSDSSSSPSFVSPSILPPPHCLPPPPLICYMSLPGLSLVRPGLKTVSGKKRKDTCAPGEWAEGCALGQGA